MFWCNYCVSGHFGLMRNQLSLNVGDRVDFWPNFTEVFFSWFSVKLGQIWMHFEKLLTGDIEERHDDDGMLVLYWAHVVPLIMCSAITAQCARGWGRQPAHAMPWSPHTTRWDHGFWGQGHVTHRQIRMSLWLVDYFSASRAYVCIHISGASGDQSLHILNHIGVWCKEVGFFWPSKPPTIMICIPKEKELQNFPCWSL